MSQLSCWFKRRETWWSEHQLPVTSIPAQAAHIIMGTDIDLPCQIKKKWRGGRKYYEKDYEEILVSLNYAEKLIFNGDGPLYVPTVPT